MSVRQGLLALLSERPMHGYQLRQEFEARTGGTWPLNIGQAYTTLSRLERDGFVEPVASDDADAPEQFTLTAAGAAEVRDWWGRPVPRDAPARDELAIKLALAVTVPGVDVTRVVQRQRTETMRVLRDYTRLKSRGAGGSGTSAASGLARDDLAWSLVLESLVFAAEAEIRWLDHVEAAVGRAAVAPHEAGEASGSAGSAPRAPSSTRPAPGEARATGRRDGRAR